MLTRVLSALVLIPLVLGAVFWASREAFAALVALLGAGAFHEFVRLVGGSGDSRAKWSVTICAALAGYLYLSPPAGLPGDMILPGLVLILGAGSVFRSGRPDEVMGRVVWPLAGFVYVFVSLSFLVKIRFEHLEGAAPGLLLTFLLVHWVGDTAAYLTGRSIGGPRLHPRLSPNKTVSGACGGLLGSALVGALTPLWVAVPGGVVVWLAVGGLTGAAGQVGDLLESQLKRTAGVKDSSNLIPGHGGVLDRLDSVIFSAPLFHVLARWLGC